MIINGLEHENSKDLSRSRIIAYGGLQYVSVDNLNKANKTRVDNFNNFMSIGFPYVEMESEKQDDTNVDDFIQEYQRLFGNKNAG